MFHIEWTISLTVSTSSTRFDLPATGRFNRSVFPRAFRYAGSDIGPEICSLKTPAGHRGHAVSHKQPSIPPRDAETVLHRKTPAPANALKTIGGPIHVIRMHVFAGRHRIAAPGTWGREGEQLVVVQSPARVGHPISTVRGRQRAESLFHSASARPVLYGRFREDKRDLLREPQQPALRIRASVKDHRSRIGPARASQHFGEGRDQYCRDRETLRSFCARFFIPFPFQIPNIGLIR